MAWVELFRKPWRLVFSLAKWLLIFLLLLELSSFLLITISNYIIYGKLREGSRVRYDPYALFLNHGGPRPTLFNPTPPAGKVLWLFGGSTMRGSTDHNDRTIPSYLARLLNQGQNPPRATVLNYGENSFNSLLETKYLQKLLAEGATPAPQVIIFYDGANDSWYFAQYRTPYAHHGYRRVRGLIESYYRSFFGLLKPLNAALYASFSKELYDKVMQTLIPLDPETPSFQEFLDLTEKRYDYVQKLAAAHGARFFLFWQPVYWGETCDLSPEMRQQEKYILPGDRFASVRHNFSTPYLALSKRLQHKPYFINLQNVLCARQAPVYQADGVHLTDLGREMVTTRMGRVLQEKLWPLGDRQ